MISTTMYATFSCAVSWLNGLYLLVKEPYIPPNELYIPPKKFFAYVLICGVMA